MFQSTHLSPRVRFTQGCWLGW